MSARRARAPIRLGLLLPILLPAAPAVARQAPATADAVGDDFGPPAGWVRVEPEAGAVGTVYTPADVPDDALCALMVLPPEEVPGSLRNWFESSWLALTAGRTPSAGGEIVTEDRDGVEMAYAGATLPGDAGDTAHVFLHASRVAGVVETLVFLTDEAALDTRHRAEAISYAEARALDRTSRAPPAAAEAAPAHAVSTDRVPTDGLPTDGAPEDGLEGLYVGYDAGAGFDPGVRPNHLVFFRDGSVMWHLPDEGLFEFDPSRSRARMPDVWGSYRVSGSSVEIVWSWGAVDTATLGADGRLSFRGDDHLPRTSCDGLLLEGTYGRAYPGDEDEAEPRITLGRDGTFSDTGILRVVGIVDLAYGRPVVPTDPGAGRYACSRNTLRLDYTDGRTARLSFYVSGEGASPEAIVLHGRSLSRLP